MWTRSKDLGKAGSVILLMCKFRSWILINNGNGGAVDSCSSLVYVSFCY